MAKLDKKTRDNLKDSDFGIPSKRMYPIHDKEHVEAAVKLFGHASNEDKPELAHRILIKAKEFGMDSSGWTQVNLWAKKYKTESITEAAAGASLLTVKNQLMRMVGNAFKFIGGSLVPKFTMQSTEKPEVSFDVNAVGQNIEVTPKYNGTPDTMHKRKGIAFMRAADTIADFVQDVVNSFSGTPATATESFYISIKEDRLYDMEDFNAYFEGSEYMNVKDEIYLSESEYIENSPFTVLLEHHGYNKESNTIDINGKIKNVGIFGSKDVQRVLNAFMRDTDKSICIN